MAIPVQGYPDYLIGEDGRIWSEKTHKYLKPAYTKTAHGDRKTAGGYIWRREEG